MCSSVGANVNKSWLLFIFIVFNKSRQLGMELETSTSDSMLHYYALTSSRNVSYSPDGLATSSSSPRNLTALGPIGPSASRHVRIDFTRRSNPSSSSCVMCACSFLEFKWH
jgi:hypothetical protein